MKRAKTSDALWGAGLVPQTTRDQFKNDPRLSSAASMKDIFGSVDFASGVNADLNVDTANEADAKDLASKATAQLAEVRKSPQFMMMGLAQYLDGLKIDSKGATFHLAIVYNQQQVDDLINRVKGLLKSFGGAMGGGGMPPAAPPNQ
jgi:CRISPR/Cas system CMR-associated protein Cmr1 (group 7 of RAMP superfamily)